MAKKVKYPVTTKLPGNKLGRYIEVCRRMGLLMRELEKLDGEVPEPEMIKALERNGIRYLEINEPPSLESN